MYRKEPPATVSELSYAIGELDQRLSNLKEAQSKLELEVEEDELEREIEAEDFRYEKQMARRLCEERLHAPTAASEASRVIPASSVSGQSHGSQSLQARLPKLELPKFSGDITQWQSFWDHFSHIYETDLPVISKLTYLLSLVDGSTKDVVQGILHTSDSYKVVTKLLTQCYGRPERIIHAHVQAQLSLHVPLSKGPKYTLQLWKLMDEVVKHKGVWRPRSQWQSVCGVTDSHDPDTATNGAAN